MYTKLSLAITLVALSFGAGCTYTQNETGAFTSEGMTFRYKLTNTEIVGALDDDDPRDFVYEITFPDGSTRHTFSRDSKYKANIEMDRLVKQWQDANRPKTSKPVAQPTTASDTNEPSTERGGT